MYHHIVPGKILKKYKLISASKNFFKYKSYLANKACNPKSIKCLLSNKKKTSTKEEIQRSVMMFLEDDENSILSLGKKDYTPRRKVKKQKRYLSVSLKNLRKKYLTSHTYIN